MDNITILHNPRCSKSREGMKILEESGQEFEIINYMDTPLSTKEIKEILSKLNMSARELMRTKEDIYRELNLKNVDDENALIAAMAENPKLIERPIVIKGDKAVIGRPSDNISNLIN